MSRFFFHLTMDDEYIHDLIGLKFNDLAAAQSHAVALVSRLMAYCEIEGRVPRTERWVVTIENDAGRVLMSVIVRCDSAVCDVGRVPTRYSRLASHSC